MHRHRSVTFLLPICSRWCWTVLLTPASPTSTSTSPTSKTPSASPGLWSVSRNIRRLRHIATDCCCCAENFLMSTDAGVFLLCDTPADYLHLRSEDARMWLDVGLDHLLCRRHGSGKTLDYLMIILLKYMCTCVYIVAKRKVFQELDILLCSSSRPSGATWEHHCILALLSHIESRMTSGGLLPSSTSCSQLCRLC